MTPYSEVSFVLLVFPWRLAEASKQYLLMAVSFTSVSLQPFFSDPSLLTLE